MNLTPNQRRAFAHECTRGRLFLWASYDWPGRVNHWYQRRMRRAATDEPHYDHVGVIGDEQGAYESMLASGPNRNRSVRRYLDRPGHLMIGEVVFEGAAITEAEIDFGMAKLIQNIQRIHDKPLGIMRYDLVSLLTFGRLQANNRMICSELAVAYLDEALRKRDRWALHRDFLVLPDDLLEFVRPVWDSREGLGNGV